MKLSIRALAIVAAVLWGGCLLFVGALNLISASYGAAFLQVMSSVYPGFHASRTFGDVLVGGACGAIDGAICGALVAWLYNALALGPAQRRVS